MGTHHYRLEVTRKYGGRRLSALSFTLLDENHTSSTRKLLEGKPSNVIYRKEVGCRERIMDFMRPMDSWFFGRGNTTDLLFGIRCYGEMYAKNGKIIKKYDGGDKAISKFFSKIFGMKFIIKTDDIPESRARFDFIGRTSHKFHYGGTITERDNLTTITVYLRSKDNKNIPLSDTKISAVLALLKESRIIGKILEGEISSPAELANELFSISADRANQKDTSYDYMGWFGGSSGNYTFEQMVERGKNQLSGYENTDGSDWISIAYLAVFVCLACFSKSSFAVISSSSGPATFAKGRLENMGRENLAQILGKVNVPEELNKATSRFMRSRDWPYFTLNRIFPG